jgi:chromosome segregation ATPase
MTGGSVNKEAGILSRANELEKLTAQEKQYNDKKLILEAELTEAQRLLDEVEFQMTAAREQLRDAEDSVLRLQGEESSIKFYCRPLWMRRNLLSMKWTHWICAIAQTVSALRLSRQKSRSTRSSWQLQDFLWKLWKAARRRQQMLLHRSASA